MRMVPANRQETFTGQQIAGIMRIMKKLGEGKTVRVFVPMAEEMRDKFAAKVGESGMAAAIRDMIQDKIGPKKSKRRAAAQEREDA